MENTPLTNGTRIRLNLLFAEADRPAAEALLSKACGNNLPFLANATPEELERFRFAALKVSGGSLARLADAVKQAQTDWRDLLVAAGFAERLDAHRQWLPPNAPQ